MTPAEKLRAQRERIMRETTTKQRIAQTQRFILALNRFSKEHFPLAPLRWEDAEDIAPAK